MEVVLNNPNVCFMFMNPTGRNIASSKDCDQVIYDEIKLKKPADWTEEFAQ